MNTVLVQCSTLFSVILSRQSPFATVGFSGNVAGLLHLSPNYMMCRGVPFSNALQREENQCRSGPTHAFRCVSAAHRGF